MNKESFVDQVKMILPGGRAKLEKERGKILADRFDTIKPQLKELGVKVENSSYRDSDDRFVSTYRMSFNKKETEKVRGLLVDAGIQEIVDPDSEKTKWRVLGIFAEAGMMNDELLLREANTKEIIFYRGKYLNDEDVRRLVTLEPKFTELMDL